jgi:hypothetical protein
MHIARPGTEESTLDHGDGLRGAQKRGESGAAGKVGCGEGGVAGSGEDGGILGACSPQRLTSNWRPHWSYSPVAL